MFKKIKQWWKLHRKNNIYQSYEPEMYTREQLEKAFQLGYTDGKRDGLAIARDQATQSLKEILWEQNKQGKSK